MRCTCEAAESVHHHRFGGTYPCPGYSECRECRDGEERLWSDDGLTTPFSSNPGFDNIRRKYGAQAARNDHDNLSED